MQRDSRIYVAGHRGLAGSAIARALAARGYRSIVLRMHHELELTDRAAVKAFFERENPEYVFLAAAKAGGILANKTLPAEFIYQNLAIQTNVIDLAWRSGVKRLLFLGASCIYPRDCPQPMRESHLLTGPLEFTNQPYALAKIAGVEMCWAYNRQYRTRFLTAVPNNMYGPGDNYDPELGHVLAAFIRKFHEAKVSGAKSVTLWGTGKPRREMLHSDDMAEACVMLMELSDESFDALLGNHHSSPITHHSAPQPPLINIGWGEDYTIRELAERVRKVVGFQGDIQWDSTKPDGTPRKLLDISRMKALGWSPRVSLEAGLRNAYQDFLARFASERKA
jgi:GDP-L-fucose synthase